MMFRLFVVVFVLSAIVPAMAKKPKEWCYGNGCLQQTGNWHECKKGELNVCRKWSEKAPKW